MKYYDVLGVSPTATVTDIKIQDEADPLQQQAYDAYEYIGQLAMTSLASLEVSIEGGEFDREKLKETLQTIQKEREKKLACILKDRLNLYVQGNKEEFIRCAEAEVLRLSNVGNVSLILSHYILLYNLYLVGFLGKKVMYGVPFVAEWLRNAGHRCKSLYIVENSKYYMFLFTKDIERRRNGVGNYTEEELEEYIQSQKQVIIDHLWKANVVDIEDTVSCVCQMVVS
ncbi:hypothetical protein ACJIZ3_003580 [Penstemon smallii]|uniref:DNAJ-containing protein X-domain domain-containing protein n=1 Tax=Penstemon smallii TaxID=265156 RepID=A0ABD3UAX3_9LAMI